jgi:hypothetical protein
MSFLLLRGSPFLAENWLRFKGSPAVSDRAYIVFTLQLMASQKKARYGHRHSAYPDDLTLAALAAGDFFTGSSQLI